MIPPPGFTTWAVSRGCLTFELHRCSLVVKLSALAPAASADAAFFGEASDAEGVHCLLDAGLSAARPVPAPSSGALVEQR